MERYTTEDGSALPDELFSGRLVRNEKIAAWRQRDLRGAWRGAGARAGLDCAGTEAFSGIDYAKNAIWGDVA